MVGLAQSFKARSWAIMSWEDRVTSRHRITPWNPNLHQLFLVQQARPGSGTPPSGRRVWSDHLGFLQLGWRCCRGKQLRLFLTCAHGDSWFRLFMPFQNGICRNGTVLHFHSEPKFFFTLEHLVCLTWLTMQIGCSLIPDPIRTSPEASSLPHATSGVATPCSLQTRSHPSVSAGGKWGWAQFVGSFSSESAISGSFWLIWTQIYTESIWTHFFFVPCTVWKTEDCPTLKATVPDHGGRRTVLQRCTWNQGLSGPMIHDRSNIFKH